MLHSRRETPLASALQHLGRTTEYREIDTELLAVQLPIFRLNYLHVAAKTLTGLPGEAPSLTTEVDTFNKLIKVID